MVDLHYMKYASSLNINTKNKKYVLLLIYTRG